MEENEFVRDLALEAIVKDLIETESALIYLRAGNAEIVVIKSDKIKRNDGVPVFADCELIPDKFKWATTAQFMITIYRPNTADFDARRFRILLFQQLLKITPKEKEGKFKLRDYDVKDFSIIVDRFGANWYRAPGLFDDVKDTAEN